MRRGQSEYRDVALGRALAALDVPEYPAGFRDRLESLLEERAALPRVRARSRRSLLLAAALAAVTLALGISIGSGVLRVPYLSRSLPETASAAELMVAKMTAATSTMTTLQGEYRWSATHRGGESILGGDFAATAAGDLHVEARVIATERSGKQTWGPVGTSQVVTYDAARHIVLSYSQTPTGETRAIRRTDVWPANHLAPLSSYSASPFAYQGYVQLVKAAVEDHDPGLQVSDFVYDQHPAWRATLRQGPATVVLVVDKTTGIVVSVRTESGTGVAAAREQYTLDQITADADIPPTTFSVTPPDGAALSTGSGGAQYGTISDLERRVGFSALLPRWLPPGYSVDQTATMPYPGDWVLWIAHDVAADGGSGSELGLAYRRGFDRITITIAPAAVAHAELENLASVWLRDRPGYRVVRLDDGYLNGRSATTWFDQIGCALLVSGQGYSVLITGNATPAELQAIADSMTLDDTTSPTAAGPASAAPATTNSDRVWRLMVEFRFAATTYVHAVRAGDAPGATSLFPSEMLDAAREAAARTRALQGRSGGWPTTVQVAFADRLGHLTPSVALPGIVRKRLKALAAHYGVAVVIDLQGEGGGRQRLYGTIVDDKLYLLP